MTTTEEVWSERSWLVRLCLRMLGTVAEAEDAVQETYVRWLRMDDEERAAIEVPAAWLRRVATRICLDVLASARVRREAYVGDWLPEPTPAEPTSLTQVVDPAARAVLDESVSVAMLVVLDRMTAAERVAFVLHDVFDVPTSEIAEILHRSSGAVRQLASSARRRVDAERSFSADAAEHERVVHAFQKAATAGDLAGLVAVLAPDIALRSDGGGVARAARNPLHGADRVARFLLGILAKNPDLGLDLRRAADGRAAVVMHRGGDVTGVLSLQVVGGAARSAWFQVNPAKLTGWAARPTEAQVRR